MYDKSYLYSDIEIERPGDLKYREVPGAIRGIRSMQTGVSAYRQPKELIFKKQAVLMADYEDSYECEPEKFQLFPTYSSLTDRELRGYFTWRTRYRKGAFPRSNPTFLLLYTFEIINGVGFDTPEEGHRKLVELRARYRAHYPDAFRLYDRWLTHFVVYYRLPPELLPHSVDRDYDENLIRLINSGDYSDEELGEALCGGQEETLDPRIAGRAFRIIKESYRSHRKTEFMDDIFGTIKWSTAKLFASAVFCDDAKPRTYDYQVSELCKYRCVDGRWKVYEYERKFLKNIELKDLLETIRAEIDGSKPDAAPIHTGWMLKCIRKAIQEVRKEREFEERTRVEINPDNLDSIRKAAGEIREKLLTDEERGLDIVSLQTVEAPETPADTGESEETDETSVLTKEEKILLAALLDEGDKDIDGLKMSGFNINLLCDSINEKLYDRFFDIVIEISDNPSLIEDYIDDIRQLI